jgi:[ribosomal protein S18]-alanine N-acetyltransferase
VPAYVRPARKEDLAAAISLEQACFSAYCLTKRQLQYLQNRPSAVFLVAEQGGKVIGEGIALVRQHKTRSGRMGSISGRIYSLAVDSACRGQKIGQKLLREMVEQLSRRGVKRVYLEVEQTNLAAIRLYERNGFRSIGLLEDYYGTGKPGVHMMCDLAVEASLFDTPIAAA